LKSVVTAFAVYLLQPEYHWLQG